MLIHVPVHIDDQQNVHQKYNFGYETEVFVTRSFSVSLFRAWLLGISVFSGENKQEKKSPHGVKINIRMRIRHAQTNRVLHSAKLLTATRDSLFWLHDMEHGSTATDPTSHKKWNSYLAELLTTCFHKAVDYHFASVKQKYLIESESSTRFRKASHYTTKEIDQVTLGPYMKYMSIVVQSYIEHLNNFPQLLETVLLLNQYSWEVFENLSLNAKPGDNAGFCMLPSAVDELFVLHSKALKALYHEMILDSEVNNGYGFFVSLDEEVPSDPFRLFSWTSCQKEETSIEKIRRILKELVSK